MGFSSTNGYTPVTIEDMMASVMANVNTQFGTSYTSDTFIGTNLYKYFYALIQRLQQSEVQTSEIFIYLQQYFAQTNEQISRPVVTSPGVIEALEDAGYIAAVKAPADADAGKIYICVDKAVASGNWEDSGTYAADKLAVATIIKNSVVAGVITQGSQTQAITLTNGQSFTFKYTLPTRTQIKLRLTLTLSSNNQVVIDDDDTVKLRLLANIASRYRLGKNFEPKRYFSTEDAPWASDILLEYSTDGGSTWSSSVATLIYNQLYQVLLANITLIEA